MPANTTPTREDRERRSRAQHADGEASPGATYAQTPPIAAGNPGHAQPLQMMVRISPGQREAALRSPHGRRVNTNAPMGVDIQAQPLGLRPTRHHLFNHSAARRDSFAARPLLGAPAAWAPRPVVAPAIIQHRNTDSEQQIQPILPAPRPTMRGLPHPTRSTPHVGGLKVLRICAHVMLRP